MYLHTGSKRDDGIFLSCFLMIFLVVLLLLLLLLMEDVVILLVILPQRLLVYEYKLVEFEGITDGSVVVDPIVEGGL